MTTDNKEWFNVSDAADYLHISRQTLYKLLKAGTLPYYEVKGIQGKRIKKEDLDALFIKKINPNPENNS